ncbi:MAG: hypothetical protein MZW92_08010 [Comamonadaceae bacterium]|nr:hypothetical protein [Comamonadaceae bacterium]
MPLIDGLLVRPGTGGAARHSGLPRRCSMSFFACLKNYPSLPALRHRADGAGGDRHACRCCSAWLVLSPVMWASMYASYRDMFVQE